MKKVIKIIGAVVGVIILLLAALLIKNAIGANKPYLSDTYYQDFKSDFPLELKYAQCGTYAVSKVVIKTGNKSIGNITVFYPTELETSDRTWPLILNVNASNTRVRNTVPFFERLASWGFIVVGNDDPQAGTGETASATLDIVLQVDESNVLHGKIDRENMAVIGYSQGGAGAINAATKFDNSSLYKTMFTGSAAFRMLSAGMGWDYDVSQITIPYFMCAGTGSSDDSGNYEEGQYTGISPLFSQEENYNGITADVFKVRGRIIGAEHGEVLQYSDGYMTAWILWQLQGNEEAGTVFLGEDAEILQNTGWQDVEKNG